MKTYYGLVDRSHLTDIAISVCDALGHGNGYAAPMLIETCAAETLLGTYRDKTEYAAGTGISQIDEGTFDWLQDKYRKRSVNERCKDAFNIDIGRVHYVELEHNPLLSLIFTRLRYMTIKESIPATMEKRGQYWKDHYNTKYGKGTASEYIQKCVKCDTASLIKAAA